MQDAECNESIDLDIDGINVECSIGALDDLIPGNRYPFCLGNNCYDQRLCLIKFDNAWMIWQKSAGSTGFGLRDVR